MRENPAVRGKRLGLGGETLAGREGPAAILFHQTQMLWFTFLKFITMKNMILKSAAVVVLMVGLFLGACKKDNQKENSKTDCSPEVLDFLGCHGFDVDTIEETDGYVTIEGDIVIKKSSVLEMIEGAAKSTGFELLTELAEDRQYANPTVNGVLISTTIVANINFYIDPSVAAIPIVGSEWVAAIKKACENWTEVANCRVTMTEVSSHSGAHISFFRDNNTTLPAGMRNLPSATLARACFPSVGLPGRFVSINDNPNGTQNYENRRMACQHEIGHNLGFRHNNAASNEGAATDGCGTNVGAPQLIAGTPVNDPASIMFKTVNSANFSPNDIKAAQFLYPDSYNTPTIYSAVPGNGKVTLNTSTPTSQAPYRVLVGRYAMNGSLAQSYEFLNPGNQSAFQVSCPVGAWKFKMAYVNFGSYGSSLSNEATATIISNGIYKLTRKGTNKCLDAAGCGSENYTNVQLWEDNGYDCQRWVVSLQSDGSYELKRKGTTKNLDAAGCGSGDGTNVWLWEDNNYDCQRWIITLQSDGFYELKRKGTTKNLDVFECGSFNGANVNLWEDYSNDCQRWQMTFISN